MMKLKYSLIIPVKSLNKYLDETVPIIQKLKPDNWELIVVTDEIEETKWKNDHRVKVINSGKIGPGAKRDLAANKSSGKYLVFLDDDSYPSLDLLANLDHAFLENADCVAIGGPGVTPPNSGLMERTSGAFYESIFSGADSDRYIPEGTPKYVSDWPSVNFSIRKNEFLELEGFGSKFWPGEDTFLCNKLNEKGMKIKYDPKVLVYHHRRETLKTHLKQIKGYGLHRGNFARHLKGNSSKLKYFIPSAFVLLIATALPAIMLHIPILYWITLSALTVYVATTIFVAIKGLSRFGILTSVLFPIYAFSSHVVYGWSFLNGFLRRELIVSKLR